MNCKSVFIFAVLLLIIVTATPFSVYAKEYHSSVQLTASLQNECSSDDGSINCANNNAETIGDENIVSPQVSQSSQVETGSDGKPGPPGPDKILNTFQIAGDVVLINFRSFGTAIASCPAGSELTGGGYIKNSVMEVTINRESLTQSETWEVQVFNPNEFGERAPLQAYAECADLQ